MALVNVSRKPTTGTARQFDGTLASFTEILGARSLNGVTAHCTFNATGAFTQLRIEGGAYGSVVLSVNDWVVFPADGSLPLSIPAATAASDWAVV